MDRIPRTGQDTQDRTEDTREQARHEIIFMLKDVWVATNLNPHSAQDRQRMGV